MNPLRLSSPDLYSNTSPDTDLEEENSSPVPIRVVPARRAPFSLETSSQQGSSLLSHSLSSSLLNRRETSLEPTYGEVLTTTHHPLNRNHSETSSQETPPSEITQESSPLQEESSSPYSSLEENSSTPHSPTETNNDTVSLSLRESIASCSFDLILEIGGEHSQFLQTRSLLLLMSELFFSTHKSFLNYFLTFPSLLTDLIDVHQTLSEELKTKIINDYWNSLEQVKPCLLSSLNEIERSSCHENLKENFTHISIILKNNLLFAFKTALKNASKFFFDHLSSQEVQVFARQDDNSTPSDEFLFDWFDSFLNSPFLTEDTEENRLFSSFIQRLQNHEELHLEQNSPLFFWDTLTVEVTKNLLFFALNNVITNIEPEKSAGELISDTQRLQEELLSLLLTIPSSTLSSLKSLFSETITHIQNSYDEITPTIATIHTPKLAEASLYSDSDLSSPISQQKPIPVQGLEEAIRDPYPENF